MRLYIVQRVTSGEDLDRLREITAGVVGQPCWRARLSYYELSLDLGKRVPIPIRPKAKILKEMQEGTWILRAPSSGWSLEHLFATIATSEDEPETQNEKLQRIEGTRVDAIQTTYPDLQLIVTFSNGFRLKLFPDVEEADWSCWQMFTPGKMVLDVGPGAMWSYTPSDLPSLSAQQRLAFGLFLENDKVAGDRGTLNEHGNFTRRELVAKAAEFLRRDQHR